MTAPAARGIRRGPGRYALQRFQEFIHLEASGGILLLICTVAALAWANSPWAASYSRLWQTTLAVELGPLGLAKPLLLWINDGLMAIFFFVVGLEIKREVMGGELASLHQAALPIAGAIGGMLVPAAIYIGVTLGTPGSSGWGIPMATDIAFALGVLALLGKRIPLSLKIFLTALAIVDDIGAVLIIALFYTEKIAWLALAAAAGLLVLLALANRLGVRHLLVYTALGLALWLAVLKSGVHATVAGVLLALSIPAHTQLNPRSFVDRGRELLTSFEQSNRQSGLILLNEAQHSVIQSLETAATSVQSPLQRLEHALHPWVAFGIMPVFALANAGVALQGQGTATLAEPIALGVALGLVLGKPLGITLFAWLAVRARLASRPPDMSWLQLHGAGWLAGIGFTMALFIAGLAFGTGPDLTIAKVGILAASVVAGLVGWLLLRSARSPQAG